MYTLKSKKITELEKRLAEKIRLLKERVKSLPAYSRRKEDEKNRQDFSTVFLFLTLMGIMFFGSGWLVVALSGTILSLVIVELGLFLSIGLGFSGDALYNTFLWLRDVFASQKIKNQNKDFDQMDSQLRELERLARKKSFFKARINYQLNYVLQWLPDKFFAKESVEFEQLPLKVQIQRLEQTRRELPAYARRKKDQQVSDKIKQCWEYYLLGLVFLSVIIIFFELFCPPIILLIPPIAVLLLIPIGIAVAFGPLIASHIGRMSYLLIRDVFSSTAIKTENKQLTQLERVLDILVALENQLEQTVKKIIDKLESVDVSMQSTEMIKVKEDFATASKDNHPENKGNFKYGAIFQEVPVNQMANTPLSMPSLTS